MKASTATTSVANQVVDELLTEITDEVTVGVATQAALDLRSLCSSDGLVISDNGAFRMYRQGATTYVRMTVQGEGCCNIIMIQDTGRTTKLHCLFTTLKEVAAAITIGKEYALAYAQHERLRFRPAAA